MVRRPFDPEGARTRIPEGTKLPLEVSDRERELILKHSLAGEDLTRLLRVVPPRGRPLVVRYTLADLDELGGHVAAEANHTEDRKLRKEWKRLFAKIWAILEKYTDEDE